jgi:hypothetical protein
LYGWDPQLCHVVPSTLLDCNAKVEEVRIELGGRAKVSLGRRVLPIENM